MEIRSIRESVVERDADGPTVLVHPEWRDAWPWLVQGTTTRADDFALGAPDAVGAWARLRAAAGCPAAVHSRQPHGASVGVRAPAGDGLHLAGDADGHLTRRAGVLLAVTTADCVAVTLVAPSMRTVGIVHAGWRGAAAGILERALDRLRDSFGLTPDSVHLHAGPSICGECYEVGPEVHEALGLPRPAGPTPVDLGATLAERAARRGVKRDRITRSSHCTRCGDPGLLHSHRAGDAGRQVGFVAIARPR